MPRAPHKEETPRSPCPVAGTLDLIGDRWTLLVVRDLFWGKTKFGEFEASPEGIPTNILAARLQKLERAGLVAREPYQDNPTRFAYSLTPKGRSLGPVLSGLVTWGKRNIPGTMTLEEQERAAAAPRTRKASAAP